jgi:organic hydroperoxide reductase OsmC/OhrA
MGDIELTSTSTEGYATTSAIGEWELTIDATDGEGPNPNAVLAANYASCFIPAMRVGAQQAGAGELGRIEVDVSADLDDGDDLAAIAFDIAVEADLDGDADEVIDRGEDICHVHAALRDGLQADITLEDDAF